MENYCCPIKFILIIIKASSRAVSSPAPQGEGLG